MLRKSFPRLVDYRRGSLGFIVLDARRNGIGRRHYFSDPAAAKLRAEQIAIEALNHGTASLNFSERERVMANTANEILAPYGRNVVEAAKHYAAHLEREQSRAAVPTVRDGAIQYLLARKLDHERGDIAERTIQGLRSAISQFIVSVGDSRIDELDADRVRTYLDSLPVTLKSRQDYRLRLSGLFSYAVRKGWVTSNPCEKIKIKVPRGEIVVLSVEACERLLRAAERNPRLVPYLACCLFGSLRPFEAQQLRWENVDLETGHVHVLAATSKRREGRWVSMEAALVEWLRPHAKPSGPIVGQDHRRHWRGLMRACGYGPQNPWPTDCLRHAGCSMLLAIKRNRALVAEECGHSIATLRRHYRVPIRPADAERFWLLRPAQ